MQQATPAQAMGVPAPEMMTPEQNAQLEQNMQMLDQINRIEENTKAIQQQDNNKSHDTEFSPFADGTGNQSLNVIGEQEIKKAFETLMKYKEQKSILMRRIEDNERFWKMNHWEDMTPDDDDKRIHPKSAWLVNNILNKHADAMDNYPEPVILPRARDDEETADILSDVIPVILEQNKFQKTYSDVMWYKAKNGTGVYGVFWNNDKNQGLGDIDIKKIDLSHVFWKGNVTDIQDSPNFFYVTMMENEEIKARWPEINPGYNHNLLPLTPIETYNPEVKNEMSDMSPVIDWYYRRRVQGLDNNGIPQTKTILHYCQFCNGQVIYASENDPRYAETGWYEHGLYPFVFDVLYPIEGCAYGMGYIDLIKDDQMFADKLKQAILENAVVNARPRFAVRTDGGLDKEQFLDLSNPLIEFDGNLGEDYFRQIVASPLSPVYMSVLDSVITEMKETTGNTAATQGQSSSVTAASGIAALQEAAGKLARDTNLSAYESYKDIIFMVIELIRQFYDEPRCFRIAGDKGQNDYLSFDNSGLIPQKQEAFGIDLGSRVPILDIDVRAQKKNAYSKESQNQTALNLYNLGFFAANNADASLAALDMMDFDGIEKVRDTISQNGTLYAQLMQMQEQMMQMAQIIDGMQGTALAQNVGGQAMEASQDGNVKKKAGLNEGKGSLSSQAAATARNSTAVQ